MEPPLFIPLKREYFEAFERGAKTEEYRRLGKVWNPKTCRTGRRVILSLGYGKSRRLTGIIKGHVVTTVPQRWPGWNACYPHHHGFGIAIKIALDPS